MLPIAKFTVIQLVYIKVSIIEVLTLSMCVPFPRIHLFDTSDFHHPCSVAYSYKDYNSIMWYRVKCSIYLAAASPSLLMSIATCVKEEV